MDSNKLHLTIINPDSDPFSDEVDTVSSTNLEGPFDIWPLHSNFISIIKEYLWIYKGKQKVKELKVASGVLRVNSNRVEVYLGIGALLPAAKEI